MPGPYNTLLLPPVAEEYKSRTGRKLKIDRHLARVREMGAPTEGGNDVGRVRRRIPMTPRHIREINRGYVWIEQGFSVVLKQTGKLLVGGLVGWLLRQHVQKTSHDLGFWEGC